MYIIGMKHYRFLFLVTNENNYWGNNNMSESTVKNLKSATYNQEGGTFISKKRENFTMITNKVINANLLSPGAVGLYLIIAQKIRIPDFKLYKTNLRNHFNNGNGKSLGKRAFQTLWDELKNVGYLKQYRIRTSEGFEYQYELLDEPNKERPSLIMVKLCEELIEDENGNMVIRNKSLAVEESLATEQDLAETDSMDIVGTAKNIVVKNNDLTDKDKEYVKKLYENVKYNTSLNYKDDAELSELSDDFAWKKKREAVEDQRTDKLNRLMPILFKQVDLDHIENESDRRMGEEIMDSISDLIAPVNDRMIHICGNHWPQVKVLSDIMQKLNSETLDRTIYQIKNYERPIKNYKKFMQTTLYNNVLTYNTWFNRNFQTTFYGDGQKDKDFFEVKRK